MRFNIRPVRQSETQAVRQFLREQWGDETILSRGVVHTPDQLQGFVAHIDAGEWFGLATYAIQGTSCELVTLNSLSEGHGIGTALLEEVIAESLRRKCTRLWCITTNDNLPALGFYQKRGLQLVAVHPNAVEKARVLKPSIPEFGIDSIPIRDEIELELELNPG
jgi:GNAT superfamily N-acetyltransferase